MELEVSRETSATPDRVWAVVTDIAGSPDVLSGVERVERLDGGSDFAPGLRWRETRRMAGKEVSEELEVTIVEDGRSYTVEADSRGTRYRSVMSVEPSGAGTVLRMSFAAEPQGGGVSRLLARTMGRAFQGATRKALQQDLDDLAAAAEAAGAGA